MMCSTEYELEFNVRLSVAVLFICLKKNSVSWLGSGCSCYIAVG